MVKESSDGEIICQIERIPNCDSTPFNYVNDNSTYRLHPGKSFPAACVVYGKVMFSAASVSVCPEAGGGVLSKHV